ncbi:hypothetical protein BMF35_b0071 [Aurantiacibacter gangjinensis]|nr:hypothetical protein BMF35_b0071 [Aurantiacibacter gangjinensis]
MWSTVELNLLTLDVDHIFEIEPLRLTLKGIQETSKNSR